MYTAHSARAHASRLQSAPPPPLAFPLFATLAFCHSSVSPCALCATAYLSRRRRSYLLVCNLRISANTLTLIAKRLIRWPSCVCSSRSRTQWEARSTSTSSASAATRTCTRSSTSAPRRSRRACRRAPPSLRCVRLTVSNRVDRLASNTAPLRSTSSRRLSRFTRDIDARVGQCERIVVSARVVGAPVVLLVALAGNSSRKSSRLSCSCSCSRATDCLTEHCSQTLRIRVPVESAPFERPLPTAECCESSCCLKHSDTKQLTQAECRARAFYDLHVYLKLAA